MPGNRVKILVIGEAAHVAECRSRFSNHEILATQSHHDAMSLFAQCSVVFDFIIDEDLSQLHVYEGCKIPVFLNSVKTSLSVLTENEKAGALFFGFNGLPTFFDRPLLETVVVKDSDKKMLQSVCKILDTPCEVVADQPGMVSARVVCMIVNEAFSAVEDGTASSDDIDLAMKLGTNYPRGPLEWGRQIGLRNVCEVLDALFEQTGNQRYTICAMLREEARRE